MITKTQQKKILKDLQVIADGSKDILPNSMAEDQTWQLLVTGAVIALGTNCPPHWHMNVLCGRADRLKEEVK